VPTAERHPRRVTVVPGGPVLVEGPVELRTPEGEVLTSDRFVVAVCACRRSKRFPFCDTSHRRRVRAQPGESG
jgi:CDGSH-type Zn-finger protein